MVQPTGYRAFIPTNLPPVPALRIEGAIQRRLSEADRALGVLDGSVQTLPNPDLFVFMYVRKEAVLSSQIEGTQSSLQDLLAAEAHVLGAGIPRDVDEVVNYVHAMNHGLARLEELPVSVRLIREIHEQLLKGVRGSRLTPGDVPAALGHLENFLHGDDDLPLLAKIGLAHAQFETIHPFLDGNGRMGRLLITLLLCERQVLRKPVLYLSHYFKRRRQEYYERLQAVRDEGDWESWIDFFLQGITEVSLQAADTARQILVLRETHRRLITDKLGRASGNGHRILESLYQRPIVSATEVQALTGTTFAAANQITGRLVEAGILTEFTGQARHRRFRYDAYVRLFNDDDRA
ncbi:MAG: Fic family protein [Vicinamibacterales bacterium]